MWSVICSCLILILPRRRRRTPLRLPRGSSIETDGKEQEDGAVARPEAVLLRRTLRFLVDVDRDLLLFRA
ncbi:hypothetical protein OPV22_015644 [Ensete ventricosum]|uniref:Uncharacterized protein n=1 Tax=Ensete ventricosum TaxID=4639 RepID=A0AAV8R5Z3_ENSVE|nr:hypothetical protein OPV22_015644 [Ensete ventricosum]